MRLDKYLVEENHFPTREKSAFAIKKGLVTVNEQITQKTAFMINPEKDIVCVSSENVMKYVSRGGLKLEKAILDFNLNFEDKRVLDIGSSTGGFSDCALQNGAIHITAVDVGTNQMDVDLRTNPKIKLLENTDFRDLKPIHFSNPIFDYILSDISFISLTKLFPFLSLYMNFDSVFICLIKPQFEAGRENIGRDGIVKSIDVHLKILNSIIRESTVFGLHIHKLSYAPIHFKKKNIEYLAMFKCISANSAINVKPVVYEAFKVKARL